MIISYGEQFDKALTDSFNRAIAEFMQVRQQREQEQQEKEFLMKITNTTGLPKIIEEWAKADSYERGTAEFTTTELIKPQRILALERKHRDEITVDVTELAWRLSGQAKHVIFERVAKQDPDRYVAEQRYTMACAGTVISGQLDLLDKDEQVLYDYKESKVWKEILGADDKDWVAQANINAFLCYHIGNYPVKRLVNIVIYRDWAIRQAQRDSKYPQSPIKAWHLERWDHNRTLQYIQHRVKLHQAAGAAKNGTLPLCSPEERWQRPSKWAVMKRGRKTAVKLFDSHVEANAFIEEASDAKVLSVEERPAEDTRCLFYCDVWKYCSHGQQVRKDADATGLDTTSTDMPSKTRMIL